jgi:hypothetical protein
VRQRDGARVRSATVSPTARGSRTRDLAGLDNTMVAEEGKRVTIAGPGPVPAPNTDPRLQTVPRVRRQRRCTPARRHKRAVRYCPRTRRDICYLRPWRMSPNVRRRCAPTQASRPRRPLHARGPPVPVPPRPPHVHVHSAGQVHACHSVVWPTARQRLRQSRRRYPPRLVGARPAR